MPRVAPELAYGLAMGELLRTVGREASKADRPILFVQSPTAERRPPAPTRQAVPADDIDARPWPATGAPAVRFAIAMPPDDTAMRLGVCERIAEVAAKLGGSIEIGDYRLDRRGGTWYPASTTDVGAYEAYVRDRPPSARDSLTHVMPVTFVGPARVGTTAEIVDRLGTAGVPIMAASVSALENLAFIHVVVGASRSKDGVRDTASIIGRPVRGNAQDVIDRLIRSGVGLTAAPGLAAAPRLRLTADYEGGAGPLRPVAGHPLAPGAGGRAVWAAWQIKDRPYALEVVVSSLKAAIEEGLSKAGVRVGPGSIDYAVCRRVESGDIRGRMKVALSPALDLPAVGTHGSLSRGELCARIEHAWRSRLVEELQSPAVDVEFTWQEERLGRWNAILSGVLS